MGNGNRTDGKMAIEDFQAAGSGLGLVTGLTDLSAAGCNTFSIQVRATSAAAVAEIELGVALPNRSVVLGHSIRSVTGHTLDTATHVSLGYAAAQGYLGIHADATLDGDGEEVISVYADPIVVTADRDLQITSTNSSAVDAGTLIGDYLIHIWGYIPALAAVS